MPGEIITATTLEEAKNQLREIYKTKGTQFKEITKEKYNSYETDEREDSDNHLNIEKLDQLKATVIDLAYYKFLPDRKTAYRIILKHKNGEETEDYFTLIQNSA